MSAPLSRAEFLKAAAIASFLPGLSSNSSAALVYETEGAEISLNDLKSVEKMTGLSFTDEERKAALQSVKGFLESYKAARALHITNSVPPAMQFIPVGRQPEASKAMSCEHRSLPNIAKPSSDEDLAFMTVAELSQLIKQKKVSPVELTELYLGRLEKYGTSLLNVVTMTSDFARRQARRAEREIMVGDYRGPLHGIPYGIKDLFSVRNYPTTWGSEPHKSQSFDYDAAVVEKLAEAGAICCAKLSLGSLATGDVWFNGRTKNPWDTKRGSSGSSAGSSSALAAGLIPFAIGTETLGSIMSPTHRCRVTGLRPTFGRVSRFGAMALSWSMDKVGPICRTAEDCMLVLAAIQGADKRDPASVDRPLFWSTQTDLQNLRVARLEGDEPLSKEFDGESPMEEVVAVLKTLGVNVDTVSISKPPEGIDLDLRVEAAAAFDDFTRGDEIDKLKNSGWPGIFRAHRFVTAVEYIQTLRLRTKLMEKFETELGDYDVILSGGRGSHLLLSTNRTGHPQLLIPYGVGANGLERSVSLIGRLYDEASICALGWAVQQATGFYQIRPELSKIL